MLDSHKMRQKQSDLLYVSVEFFQSLKQNFIAYRSSKVSDCILKFTSCDNQALVGCIPIPVVVDHLNLKS